MVRVGHTGAQRDADDALAALGRGAKRLLELARRGARRLGKALGQVLGHAAEELLGQHGLAVDVLLLAKAHGEGHNGDALLLQARGRRGARGIKNDCEQSKLLTEERHFADKYNPCTRQPIARRARVPQAARMESGGDAVRPAPYSLPAMQSRKRWPKRAALAWPTPCTSSSSSRSAGRLRVMSARVALLHTI